MNMTHRRARAVPMAKAQRGVGMIEVLVAVLLLAIGVIGFAGLQVRAVGATSEAFQRSQAMVLARDLTDRMRANPAARGAYKNSSNWALSTAPKNCLSNTCSATELAQYDIVEIKTLSSTIGAGGKVSLEACQGNTGIGCLYIAWGETLARNTSTADATSCTYQGVYQAGSSCIMLETY